MFFQEQNELLRRSRDCKHRIAEQPTPTQLFESTCRTFRRLRRAARAVKGYLHISQAISVRRQPKEHLQWWSLARV